MGNLFPQLTRRSSLSAIARTVGLLMIASLLFGGLFYCLNRNLQVIGLASDQTGQVSPGLLIVAFADGTEIARASTYSTAWDNQVPTRQALQRGRNFELKVRNKYEYVANPFDMGVFVSTGNLKADDPAQFFTYTPSKERLDIVVIDPQSTSTPLGQPLCILDDGRVILHTDDLCPPGTPEPDKAPSQCYAERTLQFSTWMAVLVVYMASFVSGLCANIIASYLQQRYELLDEPGRITVVAIVCALSSTVAAFGGHLVSLG